MKIDQLRTYKLFGASKASITGMLGLQHPLKH